MTLNVLPADKIEKPIFNAFRLLGKPLIPNNDQMNQIKTRT